MDTHPNASNAERSIGSFFWIPISDPVSRVNWMSRLKMRPWPKSSRNGPPERDRRD